jgi:hypothetical protein
MAGHLPKAVAIQRWLARVTAAVVLAGSLAVVQVSTPALAEGPRQPRSSNSGLVAPEIATDLIPTNIVIGPRAGESCPRTEVANRDGPRLRLMTAPVDPRVLSTAP